MPDTANLETIARELYRAVPSEFTALRNARAKDLASRGDRDDAAAVRTLPKPSASAWALNRLGVAHADIVSEFSKLGEGLRGAQKRADRAELDRLVKQRRTLVARTLVTARQDARDAGVDLSAAALREIEQTLQAALADGAGSDATFGGLLVRPIRSDGLEPADLDGAVALAATTSQAKRPAQRASRATAERREKEARATDRARRQAAADAVIAGLEKQRVGLEAERSALADEARELQQRYDLLEQRRAELDDRAAQLDRQIRSARARA